MRTLERESLGWCFQILAAGLWIASTCIAYKTWTSGDVLQLLAAIAWLISNAMTFPGLAGFYMLCNPDYESDMYGDAIQTDMYGDEVVTKSPEKQQNIQNQAWSQRGQAAVNTKAANNSSTYENTNKNRPPLFRPTSTSASTTSNPLPSSFLTVQQSKSRSAQAVVYSSSSPSGSTPLSKNGKPICSYTSSGKS